MYITELHVLQADDAVFLLQFIIRLIETIGCSGQNADSRAVPIKRLPLYKFENDFIYGPVYMACLFEFFIPLAAFCKAISVPAWDESPR